MKIIVARYNENIDWTKQFSNVIIYNKGLPLHLENEIILPNVGREGHTYYQYIYDNYDQLDDHTVFLQGNPFDHSPDIIGQLHNLSANLSMTHFKLLSKQVLDCHLQHGDIGDQTLPLLDIYQKLFHRSRRSMTFTFGAGAQFVVSKQSILKKPKEFYLQIINMLKYDINPMEGFVIERFHPLIFE
jgi:hypothetical protein